MTGESIAQLILQSSVLIFQLIHHEQGESLNYLADKKLECASILTSLISIYLGLSTHYLSQYKKNPSLLEKLRLAVDNMADLTLRLAVSLSLSVFCMAWQWGLIGVIVAQIFILWTCPIILSLLHICNFRERVNTVDRSLVLVPMPWQINQENQKRSSRIWNKIVGLSVSVIVIAFEAVCLYGPNPLPEKDSW